MPRGSNKDYVNNVYANKRPPRLQKDADTRGTITFCRHGTCMGKAERVNVGADHEYFLCARCTRISRIEKLKPPRGRGSGSTKRLTKATPGSE